MTAPRSVDDLLAQGRLFPVIALDDAADAVPLARALVAGGVRLLEVTLRTPAAREAVRRIVAEVPDAIVGLGTVRSVEDVDLAVRIGAQFLISPGTTDRLYDAALASGLPFLPGCVTGSEILGALERGLSVVKFFPAAESGGLATIKALRGPFGTVRFCPTGGIGADNFREWLRADGVAAVGGSWLAPQALIKARAWADITAIARAATG